MRPIRSPRDVSTRTGNRLRPQSRVRRNGTLEVLEGRLLLAGDTAAAVSPWHNSQFPLDVNHDNHITAKDALLIINDLLAHGSHGVGVPTASPLSATTASPSATTSASNYALDVTGDNVVSPADLIRVINLLEVPKLVQVSTFATDLSGNPITSITAGQDFLIETDVLDIRNPVSNTPGVFASYVNVSYDTGLNLASVASNATINFAPFFSVSQTGDTTTPGQLTGVGAAGASLSPPGNTNQLVWTVLAHANSAGLEQITPSFDSAATHDTLVYGLDDALTSDQISFVPSQLQINALPVLSINSSTSANEGNSGTTPFVFTVSLSAPSPQPVTVVYQTSDGTQPDPTNNATVGDNDYAPISGTLTFAANTNVPQLITVLVNGDTVGEQDEQFLLNLSSPSVNAVLGSAIGVGTIVNDDFTPALAVGDVTVTNVDSGSLNAVFTVTLSVPATEDVTVQYATAPVTAVDGSVLPADYTGVSGTLTFHPGTQSLTIPVPIIPDPFEDATKTFQLNLSNQSGNAMLGDGTAIGTIIPAFAVPSLAITSVSLPEGNPPNNTNFVFTVTLSNSPGQTPVVVQYSTADGNSADPTKNATTANNDYIPTSGTLTFNSGTLSRNITVPVVGDTNLESTENFLVNLTPVTGVTGTPQGVGTILNDDGPPTLTISDATVIAGTSGTTNAVFTVTLSSAVTDTVHVPFATMDNTAVSVGPVPDYVAQTGQLTFVPNGPLQQVITVPILPESAPSNDETFFVNLSNVTGGGAILGDSQALGTILRQGLTVNDVSVVEGNPGQSNNAVFTVSLSSPQTHPVTVSFATQDGSSSNTASNATVADNDYTPTSGTLTFLPGATTQFVTVPITADSKVENNESFTLNLSQIQGTTLFTPTAVGTILNDDGQRALVRLQLSKAGLDPTDPTNWLQSGSVLNVGDNFQLDVFVQDIQGAPQGIFAAYLNALYNSTLVSAGSSITFDPTFSVAQAGSTSTPGVVSEAGATSSSITPPDDPSAEQFLFSVPMKAVDVGLANFTPTAATSPSHPVLEYGNDQPIDSSLINFTGTSINIGSNVFAANNVSQAEGNSGKTAVVFTVTRFLPTNTPATVEFSTSDGTGTLADHDYDATSGTLTFATGVTTQNVTVMVDGDVKDENNETFFLNLANPTGGATASKSPGVGTILNDDAPVVANVSDAIGNEGDNLVFTVSLSAVSGKTVTVTYNTAAPTSGPAATAGSDYTPVSGTLTFAPGGGPQTVTVAALADVLIEPTEKFQLVLSNPVNATIGTAGQGSIVDIPPAVLSGSVYADLNGDGVQDGAEGGIGNVLITATRSGNNATQTVLTQADGTFTFVGLQAGTYTLTETQPGFFGDGRDTHAGKDSATNDKFTGIVLAPSASVGGYNFGETGMKMPFALAFANRRAFFASAVVSGDIGPQTNTSSLNLIGGDVYVAFDGGWQGARTIRATYDSAQGFAKMTLLDANLNPLAYSTSTATGSQLVFNGSTGAPYFLKLTGTNAHVSLQIDSPVLSSANIAITPSATSSASTTSNNSNSNTSTGNTTNAVTSNFASNSVSLPSAQPSASTSSDDTKDATDNALADEDDWITQLLAA